MLNAVQNRMVEEALVEKGVYDSMLKIRADIDQMIGPGAGSATAEAGSPVAGKSAPIAAERSPSGMPLPDLPPAVRPPTDRRPVITPSLRDGPQPGPADGATDAGIPAEVMAVGDPERDPNRPVAAYVPPTQPSSLPSDPFPQLGLHGKPLG